MRKKVYDPENHCILYFDTKADEAFWDNQWEQLAEGIFKHPPRNGYIVRTTKKFLPIGSRIMEGGCGLSQMVYSLVRAGYDVEGVDYAPNVVEAVNQHWPHLKVSQGDVRNIASADGFFDGYWSFGVIEHFPDGYEDIAREMGRILRPGGYLFISFPCFNGYRKRKARSGLYPILPIFDYKMADFYQFALDPVNVRAHFEALGFELVEQRGTNSLLGLAEDSKVASLVQSSLRRLHERLETVANSVLDLVIGDYAGHSALLIFRKKG